MDAADKLKIIKNAVKTFPDFPKQGIVFKDIFGIFQNVTAMRAMRDLLIDHIRNLEIDAIVGLDSRGFLLGPLVSIELGKPFIPIRKKGKLPGKVQQETYTLEYGEATFEIQMDVIGGGSRVVIIDDLLATGGSMAAAIKLIETTGAHVEQCVVLMELVSLKGRAKLKVPTHSFIQYD